MKIIRNADYNAVSSSNLFLYNVGSGGTRYHVVTQRLRTTGFIIGVCGEGIYVDPGIGALLTCREYNINLEMIKYIFVSHAHLDHVSDTEGIIEVLTSYRITPLLIVSPSVVGKKEGYNSYLSNYHLSKVRLEIAEPDKIIRTRSFELRITPALHHEKYTRGFVLRTKSLSIGYVSDSAIFPSYEKYFRDVDVLILHPVVVKRTTYTSTRHASLEDIKEMMNKSSAKYILLRHIGYEILHYGLDKALKFLSQACENEEKKITFLLDKDAVIWE